MPKYGFTASTAFSGNFFVCVCCLFVVFYFIKTGMRTSLNAIFRSICNRKPMGYFSCFLMVFLTLKLNCFLKKI